MENKNCAGCNEIKPPTEFHSRLRKNGNIYYCLYCKTCEKLRKQEPEYVKKSLERHKEYYAKNKDILLEKVKIYNLHNIEKVKNYQNKYHKEENVANKRNERRRNRRKNDQEYRIMCNLSSRITKLLKSNKTESSCELIGCKLKNFKLWIEYQFDSHMSWNNYGEYWQIDHVKPCNSFDLNDVNEQYKCFHWTNCRPLEKVTNIQKSDKIIPYQILLQEIKLKYFLQHVQIAGTS